MTALRGNTLHLNISELPGDATGRAALGTLAYGLAELAEQSEHSALYLANLSKFEPVILPEQLQSFFTFILRQPQLSHP